VLTRYVKPAGSCYRCCPFGLRTTGNHSEIQTALRYFDLILILFISREQRRTPSFAGGSDPYFSARVSRLSSVCRAKGKGRFDQKNRNARQGDLDSVLTLYDADVVFLNQCGKVRKGIAELREELVPLAAAKTVFDFSIKQIIQSGDVALMHTRWNVWSPDKVF
jgi:hypothetical protein